MRKIYHIIQLMLVSIGVIKIVSAYEFRRYTLSGMNASHYEALGLIMSVPEHKVALSLIETHIIILPWFTSRIDYKVMETKTRLDLIEKGYDQVVFYHERFIGEYETTEF